MAIGFARKISEGSCGGCGTAAAGVAEPEGAALDDGLDDRVPHRYSGAHRGFYLYAGEFGAAGFAGDCRGWE